MMMRSLNRRNSSRQSCVWWCLYATAVLFLSSLINPSSAVFNPLDNPQSHYDHSLYLEQQQEDYYQHNPPQSPPRGGSTRTVATTTTTTASSSLPPVEAQEVPFQPPKILLKHMSMALRLTSEWNRRLFAGVHRFRLFGGKKNKKERIRSEEQQQQQQQQTNHQPININPGRSWNPPIPDYGKNNDEVEELTLFHAKTPREADSSSSSSSSSDELRRGVARWGPELLPYLEHVVKLLGISSNGVEIPLAMIYLDRACSVETIRSNGAPPCPFCMPRTVHRLSLVALLLATHAVGNDEKTMDEYFLELESLGIPSNQLEQMVDWMRAALGDDGLFVTVDQMRVWSQTWDAIFFPKLQQQQQQQQRLAFIHQDEQQQYRQHPSSQEQVEPSNEGYEHP